MKIDEFEHALTKFMLATFLPVPPVPQHPSMPWCKACDVFLATHMIVPDMLEYIGASEVASVPINVPLCLYCIRPFVARSEFKVLN